MTEPSLLAELLGVFWPYTVLLVLGLIIYTTSKENHHA